MKKGRVLRRKAMKKGRVLKRSVMLLLTLVSVMLCQLGVMAAEPQKSNNPTWQDIWNIQEYLEENVYGPQLDIIPRADIPYQLQDGKKAVSLECESAFDQLNTQYYNDPASETTGDDPLTGDQLANYEAFYNAGIALVNDIVSGPGEYCLDDLYELAGRAGDNDQRLWNAISNQTLVVIGDSDPEPAGVSFVRESLLIEYSAISEAQFRQLEKWDKNGETGVPRPTVTRAQFKETIMKIIDAYNRLGLKWETTVPVKPENAGSNGSTGGHTHQFADTIISEATETQDGIVARKCVGCGMIEADSISPISAYAMFNKNVIKKIEGTKGNTLTIHTDRWVSFHKQVFEALAERPDLELTIQYVYQHKAYTVTIPAGADVRSLCNEEGFCGFRKLDQLFGGNEQ